MISSFLLLRYPIYPFSILSTLYPFCLIFSIQSCGKYSSSIISQSSDLNMLYNLSNFRRSEPPKQSTLYHLQPINLFNLINPFNIYPFQAFSPIMRSMLPGQSVSTQNLLSRLWRSGSNCRQLPGCNRRKSKCWRRDHT